MPDPQVIVTTLLPFLAASALADRLRGGARTASGGDDRRGTTGVLAGCCGIALLALASPATVTLPLPPWAQWTGAAVSLGGALLYGWVLSVRTTPTAEAVGGEPPKGPYRMVGYPGYLSGLAIWSGMTAAAGSLLALSTVLVAMVAAYAVRISSEESASTGVHKAYGKRGGPSWRLIPFLY